MARAGLPFIGQLFALTVSLAAFYVAYKMAELGHANSGAFIASADLVTLVYIFVTGRRPPAPARAPAPAPPTDTAQG